ncbi:MAG: UDP-N-acetylmuramoyl-L-alanyl-D-glutamate--2,6-diaminopimelate ligase [Candidatus Omnitrophota bacterium]|nr:UDP-N-acetylmuramoyl-L-alanyl-D-glutamate--2,6-diaminopimelate ligase [Candidatus Omnitrophota bacterium]
MRIGDILDGVEYRAAAGAQDIEICRITDDSLSVSKGDMFIALRGYAEDGYKFIDDAISKGARAIVAEKEFKAPPGVTKILVPDTRTALPVIADNFYAHPSRKLKTIGVTGTNGKTTITYIIESILKGSGEEPGVIGTISYRLNGKGTPAKNTTPGPLELQSMLYEMVRSSAHYAVMEVSSHALDQHRVERVSFDVAIFTNITPEHLDYHKTPGDYFSAKVKIFDRLKDGGSAILNIDDKSVASLKDVIKKRVITYGLGKGARLTAKNIRLSSDSSRFDIVTPDGSFNVSTRLIGRYNISNILAAVAACSAAGIDIRAMKNGIEAMMFVPGRLEPVECGQPFVVFVDFAHTEDALNNTLSALREVSKAEIITVFGCGGDRDKGKRPLMAKTACKFSGHVVITSDNPRFEKPSEIIDEIVGGVKGVYSNYEIEPDRRKAIDKALSLAKVGSIVLIAGKGHENYQIVGDRALPFDDREVAREILRGTKCRSNPKNEIASSPSAPRNDGREE